MATYRTLAYLDEVVTKALYDANSMVVADSDNTPIVLSVPASRFVGRRSTGGIVAMTKAEAQGELNVADGADNVASLLTAAGDLLYASAANTLARLPKSTDGYYLKLVSGLPQWAAVSGAVTPHASTHAASQSDELKLSDLGAANAAVPFAGQQATNFVVHQVADSTARNALNGVVGKLVMQVDDGRVYVCTSLA